MSEDRRRRILYIDQNSYRKPIEEVIEGIETIRVNDVKKAKKIYRQKGNFDLVSIRTSTEGSDEFARFVRESHRATLLIGVSYDVDWETPDPYDKFISRKFGEHPTDTCRKLVQYLKSLDRYIESLEMKDA